MTTDPTTTARKAATAIDPVLIGISLLIATPDHAGVIAGLHAETFDEPWSSKAMARLLEADTAIAFYAALRTPPTPCGFVIGRLGGADAEIVSIGVVDSARRQGVGRALLGGFCRAAALAGAERAIFEVGATNAAALALYRSDGFTQVGTRADYYTLPDGGSEDALLLARDLDSVMIPGQGGRIARRDGTSGG
ncbi:MAG: N-acetyltransferase [Pseudomonadota bacterium]